MSEERATPPPQDGVYAINDIIPLMKLLNEALRDVHELESRVAALEKLNFQE